MKNKKVLLLERGRGTLAVTVRNVIALFALAACVAGCHRKLGDPVSSVTAAPVIHSGQSIVVMGQSNALMMAQYQAGAILAGAQSRYPGADHIIQCAVVGSGELTWTPGSINYQACLQAVKGDGRPVAFIIWWQGETEAGPPYPGRGDPALWAQVFVSLMTQFRQAIGRPSTEVIYARLGDDARALVYPFWGMVRDQQTGVYLSNGSMVNLDGVSIAAVPHYDEAGYRECAARFVNTIKGVGHVSEQD